MIDAKLAAYIGLAQRAGSVAYGEDRIGEKMSKIKIVLVDGAAPEKYVKRLKNKVANAPVAVIDGLKDALHRDNVYAVGIENADLASAISAIVVR